ncbi:MAG TPA: GGDEF domain-containing protein [Tepidisphaeraceae bacterium]
MKSELADRIRQCPNLPSLPAIAVQVLELAQKADVDMAEIARTISKDPALSGKILRTVNSSFYGRSQNISTISHALVILGLQSVKTLVLGFSLVMSFAKDKPKAFKHLDYWKRSTYAATAARVLCVKLKIAQQEEAFLAALLQDIGMLVLDRVLGEEYGDVYSNAASHNQLAALETQAIGADHAEVGGMLAEQWRLPPLLCTPITAHHAPQNVTDPALRKIADLVSLAGACADVFVGPSAGPAIATVRKTLQERYNVPEAECDVWLDQIGRDTREIASLFEINIGRGTPFEDILKRANETLVELTLQSQQQVTTLRAQNSQLRTQVVLDALTGLANRGRFDQFLADEFAAALLSHQPLSLVLLDIDYFKAVNDKYGHQNGDYVLKALGKLVQTAVRPTDLAARYGGEEIALVLPGTPRGIAATIAETVRRAVQSHRIISAGVKIEVTASFGVASLEAGASLREPAHLLKAADLALYAAKNSGRNCVRVFSNKALSKPVAA